MTPRPEPDDDGFAVYPFRRQLVEETLVVEEKLAVAQAPRHQPPQRVVPPAPPRRRSNPLKWAIPTAIAVFLVAIAGAATISNPQEVQRAVEQELVPAAVAAQKPQRKKTARVKLLFVPDVIGLRRAQAVTLLEQRKFRPRVKRAVGEPGVVLDQKPAAATEVRQAGIVLVVVGRAKPKPLPVVTPTVIVASVVGLHRDVAVRALKTAGLGVRVYGVRSRQPAGTVVAQAPKSGSRAEAGSARLNVSIG